MPPTYFPLRWESTGDQWWFVSPIDLAAANGHYDLVLELLHMDTNLLINLTSLPRIRRLETVWDDEEKFNDVAKCRSQVAQKLYHECENKKGVNSLIRAGYGGWLLYTAASAGDVVFVKELLERDPLLVFGEGEYGVTDMFYAAARSKSCEVFKMLFDCSLCAKGEKNEADSVFWKEMRNRAVHSAARGGNMEILSEFLADGCDVLSCKDAQASTVLHTAAGRGQVEVVKYILSSYDIINSVDYRGNTALHVAAYRGHLGVMKILISSSPTSASLTNNYGDTFLHMAITGFQAPGFRRLDRQIDLIRHIASGNLINIEVIINIRNKNGQTALHIAIVENIQSDIVELLMSVRYINLNIRDSDGNTPLDLLKQRPRSATSEILIKRLISAGGISNCHDQTARNALASRLRMHGIGRSPGTSFRIPDAEIFLYTGMGDVCHSSCDFTSTKYGYSGEIKPVGSTDEYAKYKKFQSMNSMTRRLKNLFQTGKKEKNADASELEDDYSVHSFKTGSSQKYSPVPLREQFLRLSSLPNNKRITALQGHFPSPSSKKKFVDGLSHGVIQVLPKSYFGSPKSAFSESTWSSPVSDYKRKGVVRDTGNTNHPPNGENVKLNHKHTSFNIKLNNYLCFGAQGLAVEKSMNSPEQSKNHQSLVV